MACSHKALNRSLRDNSLLGVLKPYKNALLEWKIKPQPSLSTFYITHPTSNIKGFPPRYLSSTLLLYQLLYGTVVLMLMFSCNNTAQSTLSASIPLQATSSQLP